MESRPIYAVRREPDRKPGMFSTYKHLCGALAAVVASWAVMLGLIWLAVLVAGRWPSETMRVVFATGLVGGTWLLARSFWRGNTGSKLWGMVIFVLACACALVSVAGVGQ